MSRNETYARDMHSYVQYWEDILEELHQPTPRAPPLLEGFWSNTDRTTSAPPLNDNLGEFPPMDIDVTPKDVIPEPYFRPKNKQPGHTYNPWRDVLIGDFVLVRPIDLLLFLVWMERLLTTVFRNENYTNYGICLLQWWRPDRGGKHCVGDKHRYSNCWNSSWKIGDHGREWVACSFVLCSSRPRVNTIDDCIKKISKRDPKVAMANLEEANVHDP